MSQTLVNDKAVEVRELPGALLPLREQILADLTMLAQIPGTDRRGRTACPVPAGSVHRGGTAGSGSGRVGQCRGTAAGPHGERTIMLAAHLTRSIRGPSITTSRSSRTASLVRAWATTRWESRRCRLLPQCLAHLGIQLDSQSGACSARSARWARATTRDCGSSSTICPSRSTAGLSSRGCSWVGPTTCRSARSAATSPAMSARKRSAATSPRTPWWSLNHVINRILSIAGSDSTVHQDPPGQDARRAQLRQRARPRRTGLRDRQPLGRDDRADSPEPWTTPWPRCPPSTASTPSWTASFRRETGGIAFSHPLVKAVLRRDGATGHRARPGPRPVGAAGVHLPQDPGRDAGHHAGAKRTRKTNRTTC